MIGYIYKIKFPDGSIYIGQTKNPYRRFESYKTLKCENQKLLYNKLRLYGWNDSFVSIICKTNYESLDKTEIMYINKYKSCARDNPKGLNILKESYEEYLRIKHTIRYPKQNKRKIAEVTFFGDVVRVFDSMEQLVLSLGQCKKFWRNIILKKKFINNHLFKYLKNGN